MHHLRGAGPITNLLRRSPILRGGKREGQDRCEINVRIVTIAGGGDSMSILSSINKLRREYLRKKLTFYTLSAAGGVAFIFGLWITIDLLRNLIIIRTWGGWSTMVLVLCAVAVITAATTYSFGALFRKHLKGARAVPYAPPVTCTTPLPAEEVLVRGSDEPLNAQQDILLRAAALSHEERAELLLRPAAED